MNRRTVALCVVPAICCVFRPGAAQVASLPATLALKSIDGAAVPFQNGMPVPLFERQQRVSIELNGIWRKQRFTASDAITLGKRDSAGYTSLMAESAGRTLPSYDDAAWTAKILPAVENTMHGIDLPPETYEDGVWYRKAFDVPDTLAGRFARLIFIAVNYVADVWLNGQYLGYHEGGYTSFAFDATAALRVDTTNVLVVRVDNPSWGSRDDIIPYGTLLHKPDWFNYTGIIHDVYLEFSEKLSIARVEAIPESVDGTVEATVTVWNKSGSARDAGVSILIYEAQVDSLTLPAERPAELIGPLVYSGGEHAVTVPADSARPMRTTIVIPSPKLWSPKQPSLYILRAVLTEGADTVDVMCTQFGIRTLSARGNTLVLNGKPMFFPGVARHEDHYVYGRSVPKPVIVSDLRTVRRLNATLLRTAHYPNDPYTYLIADRLGIAVLEEIPLWWFDESDAWLKQDALRHIHEQMWREMVFRDRNRPSIAFWSTCNECNDVTDRQSYIQRLNTELDALYPDGRFVTQSAAADRPGPYDPTQAACDVAGWTMYFGIFHGGTYYEGTRQFLQSARATYPSKPIIDTEFGYWSTEDLASATKQVTVFDSTFMAFNEFVAVDSNGVYRPGYPLGATTWWCVYDWFTVQTGNQTMGLYKMDRVTEKPVAARLRDTYRPFRESSETATLEAVKVAGGAPSEFRLEQNYPNPFNPRTDVRYQVPEVSNVDLTVYDVLGQRVATLVHEIKTAGKYEVRFDGSSLASGVYIYRLTVRSPDFAMGRGSGSGAGRLVQTRKMILVK